MQKPKLDLRRLRDSSIGSLRDRAGRLRNIQSLGSQVDRLRQARLRGEYLVPVLAFLILAAALGLSYYASSSQTALGPPLGSGTAVAVGATETTTSLSDDLGTIPTDIPPGDLTGTPGVTDTGVPLDPGLYPGPGVDQPTLVNPLATDGSLPGDLPPAVTETSSPSDTGGLTPDTSGAYPGPTTDPNVPDPNSSGQIDVPTPDLSGQFPDQSSPTTDPNNPPPITLPTPEPAPTTIPDTGAGTGEQPTDPPNTGYPPPTVDTSGGSTVENPTEAPPPTEEPLPTEQSAPPTPEIGTGEQPTTPPNEAQTTAPEQPTTTPTEAAPQVPTPTATPLPTPTPTVVPAMAISGNVRWTAAQSPVTIDRNSVVTSGSSLQVDPGVEIRIKSGVDLFVEGQFRVSGTVDAPVRIVGPDGRWDGIIGQNGSEITIEHAQIRNGGRGGVAISSSGQLTLRDVVLTDGGGGIVGARGADIRGVQVTGNDLPSGPALVVSTSGEPITVRGSIFGGNQLPQGTPEVRIIALNNPGPIDVQGNAFTNSGGSLLEIRTAAPLSGTIRCNGFRGSAVGVELKAMTPSGNDFHLSIDSNAFEAQATYGIASTVSLNAASNWWGDRTGPHDAQRNPQGQGVRAGVNVVFAPPLTARPGCAPVP